MNFTQDKQELENLFSEHARIIAELPNEDSLLGTFQKQQYALIVEKLSKLYDQMIKLKARQENSQMKN